MEPPYGDFSPDEPGTFDDEDEGEEGPTEQGRAPPSVSPQGEGETLAGRGEAGEEPPPGQPAPQSPSTERGPGGEAGDLPPSIPIEDEGDESVSMPDPFEDLVGKRWGFSSAKRARR